MDSIIPDTGRYLVLTGGVGGAKLVLGLYHRLGPDRLTVVVNTGDDFEHLGLYISPDLDTVMYTLAGVICPQRGWGRADDSWVFLQTLTELGAEDWFRLGDRDMATHVLRTALLKRWYALSTVTEEICRRFGLKPFLLPMADQPVRTIVQTMEGPQPFQEYFVKKQCKPHVTGFHYEGAEKAVPVAGFVEACADPTLSAIIFCPSNPFVSIDPILALPGVREAITRSPAVKVAVSPLISGNAVKGPLAKMMDELGIAPSNLSIAKHYGELIDGIIIHHSDGNEGTALEAAGCAVHKTNTLMLDLSDKIQLAQSVLAFSHQLSGARRLAGT